MSASLATAWPASAAPERARWMLAVAVGVVIGVAQTLWIVILPFDPRPFSFTRFAIWGARWVPLFVALCCVLLWATRSFHSRAGAGQPQHQFAWTVGCTVLAALLIDPLCYLLADQLREALSLPRSSPWDKWTTQEKLAAMWSRSVPWAAILATMWVCVDRYLEGARRSAQALASAQLRLAGAQRRVLDEQLCAMHREAQSRRLEDRSARPARCVGCAGIAIDARLMITARTQV